MKEHVVPIVTRISSYLHDLVAKIPSVLKPSSLPSLLQALDPTRPAGGLV